MEQHLPHTEKRQSKINSSSRCRSPLASGSLLAADAGLAHTRLCHRIKKPILFPQGTDNVVGWARGHMIDTSVEQRRTHWVWNRERYSQTSLDKLSTGNEDSLWGVRKCWKPRAFILMWPRRGWKAVCTTLPFPTECYKILLTWSLKAQPNKWMLWYFFLLYSHSFLACTHGLMG